MRIIDKLAWIAIDNKMVLSTRSFGKDKFYIPGGKREAGETDEQALLREIKEELNVDLDKTTLEKFGIFEAHAHGHTEGVMVKMTCYTAGYTGQLSPQSEIEEMAWLTYADMNRISDVDKLIFDYLKANDLIS